MFWLTKAKREAAAERERDQAEFLKRLGEVLEIRLESPGPPAVSVRGYHSTPETENRWLARAV